MKNSVVDFYNRLAASYPLIYQNWDRSVVRQGRVLDRVIRRYFPRKPPGSLLDCSCGVGTQAIGLALRGYPVQGTDLSPRAVEEARRAAKRFKVKIKLGTADFRKLDRQVPGQFDAVISCDNALAHLLNRRDLSLALKGMKAKLKPGGLLLLSIRDYDAILKDRPSATPTVLYGKPPHWRLYFQFWNWAKKGLEYEGRLFLIRKSHGRWESKDFTTRYRALSRSELTGLLKGRGFKGVQWHESRETGYFQPILTCFKPG
jgi:glycine/sarcosine N-methyltransferase